MALKTDYRDDIFAGERKYRLSQNADGTTGIADATAYTQEGDRFGANDINATNKAINRSNSTKEITLTATNWQGASAPYTQQISVSGITEHDVPIGSAKIEKGAAAAVKKAAECIDGLETGNGTITFYCNRKKPIADVTVILKGVE